MNVDASVLVLCRHFGQHMFFLHTAVIGNTFPFVPYVTKNSFLRIVVEMPFYYVVSRLAEIIDRIPGHWEMTISVAIIEGLVVCSVAVTGWCLLCLRK